MATQENTPDTSGGYNEKTWFRFLVLSFILCLLIYIVLHVILFKNKNTFELIKLNQSQTEFIARIYTDTIKTAADTSKAATATKATPNCSKSALVMNYLDNVFDKKQDSSQRETIKNFITAAKSQDTRLFLGETRFKVHSYFWLTGPLVYLEVLLFAIFGVLCNLLYNMGVVSSNANIDPDNPKSKFDSSEIPRQIAKILYAPICTLVMVLGYNFFKDQNIVDISSGKGTIVFAFIGGFYSGRVITLMDRLKDVLFPASSSDTTQAKKL